MRYIVIVGITLALLGLGYSLGNSLAYINSSQFTKDLSSYIPQ